MSPPSVLRAQRALRAPRNALGEVGRLQPQSALLTLGLTLGLTLALAFALAACKQGNELAEEHLRRGDLALSQGQYAQALAAYGHAREIAPSDATVQRAMMLARVHLIAESAARIGPEAVEDARYEATLLLETDKPRAHVYLTALGNILLRQGDIEGAKAKFTEALAADPTSPLAHTALGLALMARKEDAALARAQLALSLQVKPTDVRALAGLGQMELAEGDFAGATTHLLAAIKIADDFDARMALGTAHLRWQKPAEAVPHFRRAADLDPKSAAAFASLGQALLAANDAEQAERALRTSLQMRPDLETEVAYGYSLARQKKTEAALATFLRALSEDPASPTALHGAGLTSEELGRKEQAIELFRRLAALPPGGPQAPMLSDLQRSATAHLTALVTPAAPSASAGASQPGASQPGAPQPGAPRSPSADPDVLGTRK